MANEKFDLDWFPLKWQKFLLGTLGFDADHVGGYILLLIHEWDKGFCPEDLKELKKISRLSSKKLDKVLEKFEKIDGKYYNDTLEIIRIEQQEKYEKNSVRGKNGAKARWDKHKLSITQALLKQCLDDSIREEEKREEEIRIEEKREEEIIPPELIFNYMIDGKEILSVEETFKENFPVIFTDFQIKYGGLKFKKWLAEFSERHKQKSWKDMQDFRNHISNFIHLSSTKENEKGAKGTPANKSNTTYAGKGPGKW